jgi:2'-5' RNA ligase
MSSNRYFIAVIVPPPFLEEIESIKSELREKHGLKGALRSPAHITLHRPFEWKISKSGELLDKLSEFSFNAKFNIELKNFAFFEPRVIYVDVRPEPSLIQLHEKLASFAKKELGLFNEAEDLRGFHPHVTIAFRDLKKRDFPVVKHEFKNRSFNANFPYSGFSLLRLKEKWVEERFYPAQ